MKPNSNPYRPGDKVIVAPEPICYYGKLSQNLHEAVQLGGVYIVAEVKGNYLTLAGREWVPPIHCDFFKPATGTI